MGRIRRNIAWAVCLLGLVLLVIPLPHPARLGWSPLLRDACHAWLFLFMTWLLLRHWLALGQSAVRAVLRVTTLMLALAAGTELAQSFTGRSVDAADFGRDVLGLLAGICLACGPSTRSRWQKAIPLAIAGLPLLLASLPLLRRAREVVHRQALFPTLEDWSHDHLATLWSLEHNGQERPLHLSTGAQRLHIPIQAKGLTSLHGDALGMDWSHHSRLSLAYELKAPQPVLLGLRVDAAEQPTQRLTLEARLSPGSNHIHLPLPTSEKAQKILRQVGQLVLYTLDPGTDGELALGRIALE